VGAGMCEFLRMTWMAAAMLVVAGAVAPPAGAQDVVVKNAKVTVAAADPADARVIGTLSNPSMYPTYLVSATSDAAERVELRDARKNNALVKEVEIPAYGALTLEAKGLYLKLVNPKKPLRAGTRVEVVLSNEAQGKIRMSALVGP
jgi:copper(I)-binding protein